MGDLRIKEDDSRGGGPGGRGETQEGVAKCRAFLPGRKGGPHVKEGRATDHARNTKKRD